GQRRVPPDDTLALVSQPEARMNRRRLLAVVVSCALAAGARADELDKQLKERKHRDPERRIAALEFLAMKRYPDTMPAIAGALKDREEDVRVAAAKALWDVGSGASDVTPQL